MIPSFHPSFFFQNLAVVERDSESSGSSASESSDEDDSDTDVVKQDPRFGSVTPENMRLPRSGAKPTRSPKIEVLNSNSNSCDNSHGKSGDMNTPVNGSAGE